MLTHSFQHQKPRDPFLPTCMSKNSGQIFSEEIMKFLKLLERGTLYDLFSLSLSISLDLAPANVLCCSCIGLTKACSTLNLLLKTSVLGEHWIFTKQPLFDLRLQVEADLSSKTWFYEALCVAAYKMCIGGNFSRVTPVGKNKLSHWSKFFQNTAKQQCYWLLKYCF